MPDTPSRLSRFLNRHGSLVLLVLACVYYSILLTDGHLVHGEHALVTRPEGGLNLVFNSMAQHLLHGRFDVDPAIVAQEGFLANGNVVAYWGISFALLRLPLALFPDGLGLDVTRLSMLTGVALALLIKLRTLRIIFRRALGQPTGGLYWVLAVTLACSGPQIEFLKSSVYQEVCIWAGVLGAAFVYLSMVGLLREGFSTGRLCGLAAIAGVALMSRVSTGIGLYVASALLFLTTAVHGADGRPPFARVTRLVTAGAILVVFGCVTAFVNYQRWGNPLVFADYHVYIENLHHPDRLRRMADYGLFNITRIPLSLLYYLFPVWVLQNDAGDLILGSTFTRLFDFTELPPSSFFLTDILLIGFFAYAIRSMILPTPGPTLQRAHIAAIAAGLSVGGILMLTAISMAFRYRIEFYPLLEFGAFLGVYAFLRQSPQPHARRVEHGLAAGAVISIVTSHCVLVLYKLSGIAGVTLASAGFWDFYGERMHTLMLKMPELLHGSPPP